MIPSWLKETVGRSIVAGNSSYLSKFEEHRGFIIAGNAGLIQENGLVSMYKIKCSSKRSEKMLPQLGEAGNKTLEQCARKCYLVSKSCNCEAFSYSRVYNRCILDMR